MTLSKYRSRVDAARDTVYLAARIAEIVEGHVKPRLQRLGRWTGEHEEALQKLREKLQTLRG